MAKIISQETYDEVLKENIVEFSMEVNEAREETIKQFELTGVNLANIIKDLTLNEQTGEPILNEAIEKVKNYKSLNLKSEELVDLLKTITQQLDISVPHKVLAYKLNLKCYLLELIDQQTESSSDVLHVLLVAFNSLTNKNPDAFDKDCLNAAIKILTTCKDDEIICETLRWLQKACVLHEMNRQLIMEGNILLTVFKPKLASDNPQVIREICACFRLLILDDDIRVEFGKAHEHAREIATETLADLTALLKAFQNDKNTIAELFLTMASLIVRNEFCELVKDSGGLKHTLDAMVEYHDSVKVIREALKLLKALAGNDKVKVDIIQSGAATIIESSFSKFKSNDTIAKAALACISTLALRVKDNSTALFEAGIPEVIAETMKLHPKNKTIQRNAAWAIRNMVSRSREQCETFISFDVEDLLNIAMREHPSIAQDCKAALRDLGCKVHLNEEWKGKSEIQITQ